MQIIIPLTYALADIWYNLSFYGDLVFTIVRTLFVLIMTHLLSWSRDTKPAAEEKPKPRVRAARSARRFADEAIASDDASSEDSGISMCAERRRRIARLTAGVQWQRLADHGRRFRPRRF